VLIGKPLVEPGNDVVDAPRRSGPAQQTCRVRFLSGRALSTRSLSAPAVDLPPHRHSISTPVQAYPGRMSCIRIARYGPRDALRPRPACRGARTAYRR
jgi:hypothetical protein